MPANFNVNQIKDALGAAIDRGKKQRLDTGCDLCLNDENPPKTYCVECSGNFCEYCIIVHNNKNIYQNHTVIVLQQKTMAIDQSGEKCIKHQKFYRFICKQHKEYICSLCVLDKHNKCDVETLQEEVTKMKKMTNMLSVRVKSRATQLYKTKERYDQKFKNVEAEIHRETEVVLNRVRERRAQLIATIKNQREEVHATLNKALVQANNIANKMDRHEKEHGDMKTKSPQDSPTTQLSKMKNMCHEMITVNHHLKQISITTYRNHGIQFTPTNSEGYLIGNIHRVDSEFSRD